MTAELEHDDLVAAIAQQVRSLALATEHIGLTFAADQGLHPTDFRALSLIYEAERAGEPLTPRALARTLGLSPGAVTYSCPLHRSFRLPRSMNPITKCS